ncbi:MAG: hypothetical protein ACKOUM_06790, partial [Sphingopyxis sp.]
MVGQSSTGALVAGLGKISVRASTGAHVAMGDERAIGWRSDKGLSLALTAQIGGGGLPDGTVRLRRDSARSALVGHARFAPYAAGRAAVALAPTDFTADTQGRTRFSTGLAISGPLAGGFVDRLAIPVNGLIDSSGAVTLSGECRAVTWQSLRVGTAALDRQSLRLCGQGGGPLLAVGGGGTHGGWMAGGVRLPDADIRGRVGGNPFRFSARNSVASLSTRSFALDDVRAAMGDGDSTMAFTAAHIDGGAMAGGFGGAMRGAAASIGAVPFLLSQGDGRWAYSRGAMRLNARLNVADAAVDDRFQPLVAHDVALSFADGDVRVAGALALADGDPPLAQMAIRHNVARAVGGAQFSLLPAMRFSVGGLQP